LDIKLWIIHKLSNKIRSYFYLMILYFILFPNFLYLQNFVNLLVKYQRFTIGMKIKRLCFMILKTKDLLDYQSLMFLSIDLLIFLNNQLKFYFILSKRNCHFGTLLILNFGIIISTTQTYAKQGPDIVILHSRHGFKNMIVWKSWITYSAWICMH